MTMRKTQGDRHTLAELIRSLDSFASVVRALLIHVITVLFVHKK